MHTTPFVVLDGEAITETVPAGWVLAPVGAWDGREAIVVYDPRRYDVSVSGRIDDRTVQELNESGWRQLAAAHAAWQARVNRRMVDEGTWQECAAQAHDAIAYAHDRESRDGMTTSEGVEALLKLGAQAREGEPVAVKAYGLSVSVRPKGQARTLWIRDRLEATTAALDRASDQPGIALDTPRI